jgi:hypothetical protein
MESAPVAWRSQLDIRKTHSKASTVNSERDLPDHPVHRLPFTVHAFLKDCPWIGTASALWN